MPATTRSRQLTSVRSTTAGGRSTIRARWRASRAILGAAPIERGLDIACGTGMSTVALAERARSVVGVDVSPEMLRAARRAPGVSYLFARAEHTPFPTATFDAATCCSGLHWFDQSRFFAELRRVLRPGGSVVLYDHYFMRMRATSQFRDWIGQLFERYPLPPRGAAVGDPAVDTSGRIRGSSPTRPSTTTST